MNRVDHVVDLVIPEGVTDSFRLQAAYCSCLNPKETCDLLVRSKAGPFELREIVIRKICADMEESICECHFHVVEQLLTSFAAADARGRQSIGFCLSMIMDHLPRSDRLRIQDIFLSSRYIGIRRRGYKSVAHDKTPPLQLVETAWNRFADPDCAWLMVKIFPAEFLALHRESIMKTLTEGWQLARLYLRIAEIEPRATAELKEIDPISYCYVLAKLGRPPSESQAIELIELSATDDRFGLLVWSLGRMKMWTALEHIEASLHLISAKRMEYFRSSFAEKYGMEFPSGEDVCS